MVIKVETYIPENIYGVSFSKEINLERKRRMIFLLSTLLLESNDSLPHNHQISFNKETRNREEKKSKRRNVSFLSNVFTKESKNILFKSTKTPPEFCKCDEEKEYMK